MAARALPALATIASGFLYALAFPPLSWKAVAWVSLVPFFLALQGRGIGAAVFLGWLWGVAASSFVADALPGSVESYFMQPPLTSYAAALGIWTLTGSLYYMAFATLFRGIWRAPPVVRPLLVGAAWAFCELLRGRLLNGSGIFVGNPWALAAYSQVGWHPLTQIASVTGVYGISFLIAAVNAGLAGVVDGLVRDRRVGRGAVLGLGAPAALTVATLGFGYVALGGAGPGDGEPAVRVAVVQGDVDMGARWRRDFYGRNLEVYLELTRRAFEADRPATVFWPEGALTFFLEEEPAYRRAIAAGLGAGGAELVTGGPRHEAGAEGREVYTNSVFLVAPDGAIRGHYDKRHLLPFSEFLPLARLDFLRRRFERVRVYTHGGPTPPLETRAGRAGILVCNESMFPEVAAERVREGAEILVSPSNDSWIDDERWAARMFDLVSLRAVEQRRYLVRASTSGPSAIVDPWGRVQARSRLFQADVILGEVRARRGLSFYTRVGDAFGLLCGLVAMAGAWVGLRREAA